MYDAYQIWKSYDDEKLVKNITENMGAKMKKSRNFHLTLYAPTFPKWEHFLKLCNSQISMKMCIFIVCMCYTDTSPYYLRFYLRKFPFFLFKKWVQKSEIHQNYFLISFLLVNLNFRSNFKFDPWSINLNSL